MRLFDTHCHMDVVAARSGDGDALLREARQVGLAAMVVPAVQPDTWARCAAATHPHDDLALALGIHPQAVRDLSDEALDDALHQLPTLLRAHGAVAVGEIGLDHRWDKAPEARARQLRVFEAQLQIARQLDLPVLIHGLNAHDQTLRLVRSAAWPAAGGVLHSYSGSAELVEVYSRVEGLMFSFCGPVTWRNARKAPAAARAVAADRLLIETDAPYQPPWPHNDRPCRPSDLRLVAETVAALREVPLEQLAEQTWANAQRLFRWPPSSGT
ncbi:MAG: hydrolase TatD [Myxococcales bacterium]|nr:hydrolase TatD [Myxococcales bacterium]